MERHRPLLQRVTSIDTSRARDRYANEEEIGLLDISSGPSPISSPLAESPVQECAKQEKSMNTLSVGSFGTKAEEGVHRKITNSASYEAAMGRDGTITLVLVHTPNYRKHSESFPSDF